MVYLLKMVIFHGYVKLPEGSRNQTTTCNQNLNVLCNASYEKGAGWYFTSRPCERHTCNNWPPTLQESNSGQALCFRSPGVATLSPYWANTWFNKMFNKTRTHTQRCIVHRGRCKSLQVERVELNLQIAISTEGHWRSLKVVFLQVWGSIARFGVALSISAETWSGNRPPMKCGMKHVPRTSNTCWRVLSFHDFKFVSEKKEWPCTIRRALVFPVFPLAFSLTAENHSDAVPVSPRSSSSASDSPGSHCISANFVYGVLEQHQTTTEAYYCWPSCC
jgi:hypothetical protein